MPRKAVVVYPHSHANEAEWAELVAWLDEHETVARIEWFDAERADRVRRISKLPGATRRAPHRKDIDG